LIASIFSVQNLHTFLRRKYFRPPPPPSLPPPGPERGGRRSVAGASVLGAVVVVSSAIILLQKIGSSFGIGRSPRSSACFSAHHVCATWLHEASERRTTNDERQVFMP
jgi:hypothetical protein